jgi:hypothetical protein
MVKASRPAASRLVASSMSRTEKRLSAAPKPVGLRGLDAPSGHRPAAGAAHDGVDVGVVGHVERAGRARPHRDAEHGHDRP